jgi:hypothetical protein
MKTFFLYVEDDKTKAIDITKDQNYRELDALCKETGTPVLGCVLDNNERDAIHYGEVVLRKD